MRGLRRRTSGRRLVPVAGALLLGTLAACGGSGSEGLASESEDGSQKLVAGVSTTSSTIGQSYYTAVPDYLGYWEDEGLDVELKRFNGSGEAVTAAATGRLDIAHAGNFSNMAAHVNGNADTQAFMQDIPGNPYFPIVLEDSPIQSLADLEGKTLGIFSTASDANELLQGVMEQEGLDSSSVNIVETGIGATAAEALKTGKIDGWMAYDSGAALLRTLGIDWRAIDKELFDSYGPGSALIATPKAIEEGREALVKYGRGVAKAMVFTHANPEAAIRIHWEIFPETKPAGVPEDEAIAASVKELQYRMDNVFTEDGLWGNATEDRYERYVDVFVASGVLADPVDVSDIWTADLIEEINDFDAAEIEQQAKDFTMDDQ